MSISVIVKKDKYINLFEFAKSDAEVEKWLRNGFPLYFERHKDFNKALYEIEIDWGMVYILQSYFLQFKDRHFVIDRDKDIARYVVIETRFLTRKQVLRI